MSLPSTKHILVTDDSVTIRRAVEMAFSTPGYRVSGAGNIAEAVAIASQDLPDLVLADASMPGETGYDLTLALRQIPGLLQTPIVILTSPLFPFDPERAAAVGITTEVGKPIDQEQLVATVETLLGSAAIEPDRTPEIEALARLSRSVVEQIAWQVIPELAETIIRREVDRVLRPLVRQLKNQIAEGQIALNQAPEKEAMAKQASAPSSGEVASEAITPTSSSSPANPQKSNPQRGRSSLEGFDAPVASPPTQG